LDASSVNQTPLPRQIIIIGYSVGRTQSRPRSRGRVHWRIQPIKLAAAQAIAGIIPAGHLSEDYAVPSVFDKRVVARAAHESGVARRQEREQV
jgi:hypothetical protein